MSCRIRNSLTGEEIKLNESKLLPVTQLKDIIQDKFSVEPSLQRLYFKGKQLEDLSDKGEKLTLFDYSVAASDVILLMPRRVLADTEPPNSSKPESKPKVEPEEGAKPNEESGPEPLWADGTFVDVKDHDTGAFFIAKVKGFKANENNKGEYTVEYTEYPGDFVAPEADIRNIPRNKLSISDMKQGDNVFVNYNFDKPDELGFWYEAKVEQVKRTTRTVICTINKKEGCKVKNLEIYKSEAPDFSEMDCEKCKKNPNRKCKDCGCRKCGGKEDEENIIMCDECNDGYHLKCLGLTSLPEQDDWYCPQCKNENNIVCAGGKAMKVKERKEGGGRDWGRGQATEGRSKECTIVSKEHFGPIPGIEVGMCWQYRIQVSEEGIHRPHVAGISGSAKSKDKSLRGCQSIVLSGGYEDDVDSGDSFLYTGSGGRDLSGNKRTAAQSSDQTLDRTNEALAWSCMVRPVTDKGGDAGDKWKEGKPVRVVRAHKLKKHSQFAPEEGFRYDGIYKVKRYWQDKGESGFKVWRYELIRDDPSPAPWTEEGMAIIEREGYVCIKRNPEENDESKKRKASQEAENGEEDEGSAPKKSRKVYKMADEWLELMKGDTRNKKMWDQVLEKELYSRTELLDLVKTVLTCQICFELPSLQVTTDCGHNYCQECLKMSFKSEEYKCPYCRTDLGKDLDTNNINKELQAVLNKLFPGV
eukprot:TRINITY_DN2230_c0_g1_i1.p1 TRINITY_DN2230_c0_g1~~TRINITY_DN2230_c0_g1_i1.p1  ORF type:complete len:698 (+),score=216.45 TRINITY_DN2230_c0_g1_i1:39-2132(+)